MDNKITLEIADLIYYDKSMENITIDKSIFDDFAENSYIEIQFADDEYNLIYTYKMIAEDDKAIYMKLMEG